MKLILHSKNFQLTDEINQYVEQKIGKMIEHYFMDSVPTAIHVNLSANKNNNFGVEVTFTLGDLTIRAEEKNDDLYKSIDLVEDKIKRQIHKYKTKMNRHFRKERLLDVLETPEAPNEHKEDKIVRMKRFQFKPMNVEEAILQMNLLDHNFFVFQDSETELMSIVYRRKHEQYGLITSDLVEN